MENVCSSIPVHPQERELGQPQDWGHLIREAEQERVEPPSLPKVGREGVPIGACQSEPGQQSHDKTVGELAGPEDLNHQPRRPTAPGVGRGVQRPTLPATVGVGGVGGSGGRRHQG